MFDMIQIEQQLQSQKTASFASLDSVHTIDPNEYHLPPIGGSMTQPVYAMNNLYHGQPHVHHMQQQQMHQIMHDPHSPIAHHQSPVGGPYYNGYSLPPGHDVNRNSQAMHKPQPLPKSQSNLTGSSRPSVNAPPSPTKISNKGYGIENDISSQQIHELKETIRLLQLKVSKMEQLMEIKDRKITELVQNR